MDDMYNVRCVETDEIVNNNPISQDDIDAYVEHCKDYDLHYHYSCTYVKEKISTK